MRIEERWRGVVAGIVAAVNQSERVYGCPFGEREITVATNGLLQTPELQLALLAESNPNYRLAVVDTKITIGDRVLDENFELQRITYYLVVKMEDK